MKIRASLILTLLAVFGCHCCHLTGSLQAQEPSPRQLVGALFSKEGLTQLFGKSFAEGRSEHYLCWTDFGGPFATKLTHQVERTITELGRVLEDEAIFSLHPKTYHVIAFSQRDDYLKAIDILVKGGAFDELTGDLMRRASSFGVTIEAGPVLISHLHPQQSEEHRAGFTAHSICGSYIDLWKTPEKDGRNLPAWLKVGIELVVDMRMVSHGGYYAIAYGKQDAQDFYRDNPQRDSWLHHWKENKKTRADLDEAFDTAFSKYTHENRMQAWMACETLVHFSRKSQRGLLPTLVETIKAGGTEDEALKTVTKWDRKRFKSRIEEWADQQKVKPAGR